MADVGDCLYRQWVPCLPMSTQYRPANRRALPGHGHEANAPTTVTTPLLHTALRFKITTSFSSNEYATQISGTPTKSPDAWT